MSAGPSSSPPKSYRLLLVAASIGGVERLVYGEAVEAPHPPYPPQSIQSTPVPRPGGSPLIMSLLRETISAAALSSIHAQFGTGALAHGPLQLALGPMVRRPRVLLPVHHDMGEDSGVTLHPDHRFTYTLDEWWDADEATLDGLWNSRMFTEIGQTLQHEAGIELHQISDRVGNFVVFERLSPWVLDAQTDADTRRRWVRALFDGPRPASPPVLHIRFLAGHETAAEQIIDLPPGGMQVSLPTDYTNVSFSLFDKQNGELLARSHGGVLGGSVSVASGLPIAANLTDTAGVNHAVSWSPWAGGSPLLGINGQEPWTQRAGHRAQRNRRLRESNTVDLFYRGQRSEALTKLRDIVASKSAAYLLVWDPYLDDVAVLDVLNWLHPGVPCKILCGARSSKVPGADPKVTALGAALQRLRTTTPVRQVDCKHRVDLQGPKNYVPIYHDRFLITKDAAWVLGTSMNSIGSKPGGVIRLFDADRLRWMFEDEWTAPQPSTVVETSL